MRRSPVLATASTLTVALAAASLVVTSTGCRQTSGQRVRGFSAPAASPTPLAPTPAPSLEGLIPPAPGAAQRPSRSSNGVAEALPPADETNSATAPRAASAKPASGWGALSPRRLFGSSDAKPARSEPEHREAEPTANSADLGDAEPMARLSPQRPDVRAEIVPPRAAETPSLPTLPRLPVPLTSDSVRRSTAGEAPRDPLSEETLFPSDPPGSDRAVDRERGTDGSHQTPGPALPDLAPLSPTDSAQRAAPLLNRGAQSSPAVPVRPLVPIRKYAPLRADPIPGAPPRPHADEFSTGALPALPAPIPPAEGVSYREEVECPATRRTFVESQQPMNRHSSGWDSAPATSTTPLLPPLDPTEITQPRPSSGLPESTSLGPPSTAAQAGTALVPSLPLKAPALPLAIEIDGPQFEAELSLERSAVSHHRSNPSGTERTLTAEPASIPEVVPALPPLVAPRPLSGEHEAWPVQGVAPGVIVTPAAILPMPQAHSAVGSEARAQPARPQPAVKSPWTRSGEVPATIGSR